MNKQAVLPIQFAMAAANSAMAAQNELHEARTAGTFPDGANLTTVSAQHRSRDS